MQRNKKILLHISLIDGVGPAGALKLIKYLFSERYPDMLDADFIELIKHQNELDLEQVYFYSVHDLIRRAGFTERIARQIVAGLADQTSLEAECALLEKHNIQLITIFDESYPEILQQIYLPPLVLYCKGAPLEHTAKRISIVGARTATTYAQEVINQLVPALVAQDWQIVSGGALGADAMAHAATLSCSGKTIAVLGSGLLKPYPDANISLFKHISEWGGSVISAFPLNAPPEKGNFPARNRIIAGLSHGCVVVQAGVKSGALITAQFALENGRQVFAVPGLIDHELSIGCHELIKQGAKLVASVNDILEEFNESVSHTTFTAACKDHVSPKDDLSLVQATKAQGLTGQQLGIEESDPILRALTTASTLDDLIMRTGFDIVELQNRLFELQLDGKVKQHFTGAWEKNS